MKTLLTTIIICFWCYGNAQTDSLYYGNNVRGVTITKMTKKKVWYKDGLFDNKGNDLKSEPTYLFDSIYCHTTSVKHFQTGGKEMKESWILSLAAGGVMLPRITDQDALRIQKWTAVSLIVAGSFRFLEGAIKLQHYEPKPSTKMVMIRFVD